MQHVIQHRQVVEQLEILEDKSDVGDPENTPLGIGLFFAFFRFGQVFGNPYFPFSCRFSLADEPAGELYYGSDVAAPVFADVMSESLRLLAIPPDALPARNSDSIMQAMSR